MSLFVCLGISEFVCVFSCISEFVGVFSYMCLCLHCLHICVNVNAIVCVHTSRWKCTLQLFP